MKNRLMIIFITLLLVLPAVLAQVKIQVGEPYVNLKDVSMIKFTPHSDYYDICGGDNFIIPILIDNENTYSDTFSFEVDKEYASLPVKSAILGSGKSVILPLNVNPPINLGEDTKLILDISTKKEGLRRSVILKTNITKCYFFDLTIIEKDEICGCDESIYNITIKNNGQYKDEFKLELDKPDWVNITQNNGTIKLNGGQERDIKLKVSPSCNKRGSFDVDVKVISEKTKIVKESKLELNVLSEKECYNTAIVANNLNIDYLGENVPVKIKNKGSLDLMYSLNIEGIDWYTLSQDQLMINGGEEKIVNLMLSPGEDIAEGEYDVNIKALVGDREFVDSIKVKLRAGDTIFGKIKFYVNYFKYYIGLGIILLILIWLFFVKIKKSATKRKEKPLDNKKVDEKKVAKQVKPNEKSTWLLSFILYLIALVLFSLFIYSTIKYKSYYVDTLNFISGLFTKYVVPYGSYLKYVIVGIGVLIILLLIIDFFRKNSRKNKTVKAKKPKEKIIVIKQVSSKKISTKKIAKRKLKFFEYIYLILVVSLFLAIVVYTAYKFSGKSLPVIQLSFIKDFIKNYYAYFLAGIVVLGLLIAAINSFKKSKKKIKKSESKKVAKKTNKKPKKKTFRNVMITIGGLIILSGIVYSFVYYNLMIYIKDFFIVYYPYILMGMGILVILILILNFQNKKSS